MGGGGRIAEGGLPLGGQAGDGQPQAIDGRLPFEAVIIGRSRAHRGRRQRSRQGAVAIARQSADDEMIRELARAASLLGAVDTQAQNGIGHGAEVIRIKSLRQQDRIAQGVVVTRFIIEAEWNLDLTDPHAEPVLVAIVAVGPVESYSVVAEVAAILHKKKQTNTQKKNKTQKKVDVEIVDVERALAAVAHRVL